MIAYLKLEQSVKNITKDALEVSYINHNKNLNPTSHEFHVSFPQMINIDPKNHGKVFSISHNKIIEIWPPVQKFVDMFREKITNN